MWLMMLREEYGFPFNWVDIEILGFAVSSISDRKYLSFPHIPAVLAVMSDVTVISSDLGCIDQVGRFLPWW